MKLIFLDIDGVICTFRNGFGHKFDKRCLKYLGLVLTITNAKIVISSSWRRGEVGITKKSLLQCGFPHKWHHRIIGETDRLGDNKVRGNEILKWLRDNDYGWYGENVKYIILDDDSDMLLWQKRQYIRTDTYFGLSLYTTLKAIYKLTIPAILS